MIKQLLTAASVLLILGVNAQNKSIRNNSLRQVSLNPPAYLLSSKTATGQTCDSIKTMDYTSPTLTISIAGAGTDSTVPTCTAIAGYVYGTNCYADKEKANFNDGATHYNSIANLSVTAVKVLFWKDGIDGTQGGNNASVGMKLYNGSLAGGPTGAGYGTTVVPMATILTGSTQGNFFFYQFNYATPVPVPASGFYASVILPNPNPGDTAVIASQVSPTANIVWEKFDNNAWHAVTETPISWGAPGNLVIIPKYCFELSGVGISKNLGISENVWVYPNPSNGMVKISTTFLKEENIVISVTNALGQVVATTSKNSAQIDVLSLDLSNQANGVYFVSISTGTDKMVTRLVLNK